MSLTGRLAVGFFFCFAVALQAQSAGPAQQIARGQRSSLRSRGNSQATAEELAELDPHGPLAQRKALPNLFAKKCGAAGSSYTRRRPYFSGVSSPGEFVR